MDLYSSITDPHTVIELWSQELEQGVAGGVVESSLHGRKFQLSKTRDVKRLQQLTQAMLRSEGLNSEDVHKLREAHQKLLDKDTQVLSTKKRRFSGVGKWAKRHSLLAAVAMVASCGIFVPVLLKGIVDMIDDEVDESKIAMEDAFVRDLFFKEIDTEKLERTARQTQAKAKPYIQRIDARDHDGVTHQDRVALLKDIEVFLQDNAPYGGGIPESLEVWRGEIQDGLGGISELSSTEQDQLLELAQSPLFEAEKAFVDARVDAAHGVDMQRLTVKLKSRGSLDQDGLETLARETWSYTKFSEDVTNEVNAWRAELSSKLETIGSLSDEDDQDALLKLSNSPLFTSNEDFKDERFNVKTAVIMSRNLAEIKRLRDDLDIDDAVYLLDSDKINEDYPLSADVSEALISWKSTLEEQLRGIMDMQPDDQDKLLELANNIYMNRDDDFNALRLAAARKVAMPRITSGLEECVTAGKTGDKTVIGEQATELLEMIKEYQPLNETQDRLLSEWSAALQALLPQILDKSPSEQRALMGVCNHSVFKSNASFVAARTKASRALTMHGLLEELKERKDLELYEQFDLLNDLKEALPLSPDVKAMVSSWKDELELQLAAIPKEMPENVDALYALCQHPVFHIDNVNTHIEEAKARLREAPLTKALATWKDLSADKQLALLRQIEVVVKQNPSGEPGEALATILSTIANHVVNSDVWQSNVQSMSSEDRQYLIALSQSPVLGLKSDDPERARELVLTEARHLAEEMAQHTQGRGFSSESMEEQKKLLARYQKLSSLPEYGGSKRLASLRGRSRAERLDATYQKLQKKALSQLNRIDSLPFEEQTQLFELANDPNLGLHHLSRANIQPIVRGAQKLYKAKVDKLMDAINDPDPKRRDERIAAIEELIEISESFGFHNNIATRLGEKGYSVPTPKIPLALKTTVQQVIQRELDHAGTPATSHRVRHDSAADAEVVVTELETSPAGMNIDTRARLMRVLKHPLAHDLIPGQILRGFEEARLVISAPELSMKVADRGSLSLDDQIQLLDSIQAEEAAAKTLTQRSGVPRDLGEDFDSKMEDWHKEVTQQLRDFKSLNLEQQKELVRLAQHPVMCQRTSLQLEVYKLEIALKEELMDPSLSLERREEIQTLLEHAGWNSADDLDPSLSAIYAGDIAVLQWQIRGLGERTPLDTLSLTGLSTTSFAVDHADKAPNVRAIPDADASIDLNKLYGYLERIEDDLPSEIINDSSTVGRDRGIRVVRNLIKRTVNRSQEGKIHPQQRVPINVLRHFIAHVEKQEAAISAESTPTRKAQLQQDLDEEILQVFRDHLIPAACHCIDRYNLEMEAVYFERLNPETSSDLSFDDNIHGFLATKRVDILDGAINSVWRRNQNSIAAGGDMASFRRAAAEMLGPQLGVQKTGNARAAYRHLFGRDVMRLKGSIIRNFHRNYTVKKMADELAAKVTLNEFYPWMEAHFENVRTPGPDGLTPISKFLSDDGTHINRAGALLILRELGIVPLVE